MIKIRDLNKFFAKEDKKLPYSKLELWLKIKVFSRLELLVSEKSDIGNIFSLKIYRSIFVINKHNKLKFLKTHPIIEHFLFDFDLNLLSEDIKKLDFQLEYYLLKLKREGYKGISVIIRKNDIKYLPVFTALGFTTSTADSIVFNQLYGQEGEILSRNAH